MPPVNKKALFPLFFGAYGRPPTRGELYWTRGHIQEMKKGLDLSINPYIYMTTLRADASKLRYIVSDLNTEGESLWPHAFTTNVRIAHSKALLKRLSSKLHTILKDYP